MNNTINGRTPEEIKKGLECCAKEGLAPCDICPYSGGGCFQEQLEKDALAYIQQLEAERDQYKRERDAAVEDLKEHGMFCSLCLHENKLICEEPCATCSKLSTANNHSNWQWRGVQEVE